jgi:hypothetical protein
MLEDLSQSGAPFAASTRLPGKSIPMTLRVLQIHTDSAWEYGLADYLRQVSGLKVKSVLATSESSLLSDLAHQSECHLLNADVPLSLAHLRLWPSDQLARSLTRLIVINLHDNVMDVYDAHGKRQVTLTRLTDLSRCIRGQYPV